jgi:hypothetical protein
MNVSSAAPAPISRRVDRAARSRAGQVPVTVPRLVKTIFIEERVRV